MVQLYDYQLDMIRRIESAFSTHQSVMVQMPTGTGKTYLLASCVYRWMNAHDGVVWIVAHRRELVEQIRDTVDKLAGCMDMSGFERHSLGESVARRPLSQLKVMSIQWLSRHYSEMEKPGLIVVDEAHHAVAKTYVEVIRAFPKAKILGVTATPCRLTRRGFTNLFELLLCSHPIASFIKDGYLSDFDYVSLSPDSDDQRKIDGMERRAADGDYNVSEMQAVLDTRPTIERLWQTVRDYARGEKGIVYAINIEHAEHVAEYYREHGIVTVAVSSKTPLTERCANIEKFKKGEIQILVNVDLFGEGFDCPDVEFVQLARPTLSLAKYLQMVGRGLRLANGKECCMILDNVGMYRLFGLPTMERDWVAMFTGKQCGKGVVNVATDWAMRVCGYGEGKRLAASNGDSSEMVVIKRHGESICLQQIEKLQKTFDTAQHGRATVHGYFENHTYVRTACNPGVYRVCHENVRGWTLIIGNCCRLSHEMYYYVKMDDGRMVYFGRVRPGEGNADGVTERYRRISKYVPGMMQDEDVCSGEYITGMPRKPFAGKKTKYRYGEKTVLAYEECGIVNSDTYVCIDVQTGSYAICNNDNNVILKGLSSVDLEDDNIARVRFCGEAKPIWVNLYTMQEFEEHPLLVRHGDMELLRVGSDLFSYKDRREAGIPLDTYN